MQEVADDPSLDGVSCSSCSRILRDRFLCGDVYAFGSTVPVVLCSTYSRRLEPPEEWLPELRCQNLQSELPAQRCGFGLSPNSITHIWQVCHVAWSGRHNTTFVLQGDSGSGKTEMAKQILLYFLDSPSTSWEGTSPRVSRRAKRRWILGEGAGVLTASFGSACIPSNRNASRFASFTKLFLDPHGIASSGTFFTCGFEKSRVTSRLPSERNFHALYQTVLGASEEQRLRHHLRREPGDYALLRSADMHASDDLLDRCRWQDAVLPALRAIDLDGVDVEDLLSQLSAILLCGEVLWEVDADAIEGAVCASGGVFDQLSELLGVEKGVLEAALSTRRRLLPRGAAVAIPLKAAQATELTNSLARHLYGAIFSWLLSRLNASVSVGSDEPRCEAPWLGIVDMFGFQVSEMNSLQQLLINYANEHLQRFFKSRFLVVADPKLLHEFLDGTNIIEAFDSLDPCRGLGILPLLKEQCSTEAGSDEQFIFACNSRFQSSPLKSYAEANGDSRDSFVIVHSNGPVNYSADKFRQRNMDALPDELLVVLLGSSCRFVRHLFNFDPAGVQARQGGTLVAERFASELSNLFGDVENSNPFFVTCINPSPSGNPSGWDEAAVAAQLKTLGVEEAFRFDQALRKGYLSAQRIAAECRSYCAKLFVLSLPAESEMERVKYTPPSIVVQRYFRGFLGRRSAWKLRRQRLVEASIILKAHLEVMRCRLDFASQKKSESFARGGQVLLQSRNLNTLLGFTSRYSRPRAPLQFQPLFGNSGSRTSSSPRSVQAKPGDKSNNDHLCDRFGRLLPFDAAANPPSAAKSKPSNNTSLASILGAGTVLASKDEDSARPWRAAAKSKTVGAATPSRFINNRSVSSSSSSCPKISEDCATSQELGAPTVPTTQTCSWPQTNLLASRSHPADLLKATATEAAIATVNSIAQMKQSSPGGSFGSASAGSRSELSPRGFVDRKLFSPRVNGSVSSQRCSIGSVNISEELSPRNLSKFLAASLLPATPRKSLEEFGEWDSSSDRQGMNHPRNQLQRWMVQARKDAYTCFSGSSRVPAQEWQPQQQRQLSPRSHLTHEIAGQRGGPCGRSPPPQMAKGVGFRDGAGAYAMARQVPNGNGRCGTGVCTAPVHRDDRLGKLPTESCLKGPWDVFSTGSASSSSATSPRHSSLQTMPPSAPNPQDGTPSISPNVVCESTLVNDLTHVSSATRAREWILSEEIDREEQEIGGSPGLPSESMLLPPSRLNCLGPGIWTDDVEVIRSWSASTNERRPQVVPHLQLQEMHLPRSDPPTMPSTLVLSSCLPTPGNEQ